MSVRAVLPAAAHHIEPGGINLLALDEQPLDFIRALLAEIHRLHRHLPHERLATLLSEFLDTRVIDVPRTGSSSRGSLAELLERGKALEIFGVGDVELRAVWREKKPDVLLSTDRSRPAPRPRT